MLIKYVNKYVNNEELYTQLLNKIILNNLSTAFLHLKQF